MDDPTLAAEQSELLVEEAEALASMLPELTVVAVTMTALLIAYLFHQKKWPFNAGGSTSGGNMWTTLTVDLPEEEIAAFHSALDSLPDDLDDSPETEAMRGKACKLLLERAVADLHLRAGVIEERKSLYLMFKGGHMSEQDWKATDADFEVLIKEMKEVIDYANILQPGSPGWGVGIFQEALDLLVKQKAEGKDEEWGTSDPTSTGLEYSKGDRVECNMGEKRGFCRGTVIRSFELPYHVRLDDGSDCFCPKDNPQLIRAAPKGEEDGGAPAGLDLQLWHPFRFAAGDAVECNMGERGWMRGKVEALNYRGDDWKKERPTAAYKVHLNEGPAGNAIFAPRDSNVFIRKAGKYRFKVGDKVALNLGGQNVWVRGEVTEVNVRDPSWPAERPNAPYKIHLDQFPPNALMYAPDVPEAVRKPMKIDLQFPENAKPGQVVKVTVQGLDMPVKVPDDVEVGKKYPIDVPPIPTKEQMMQIARMQQAKMEEHMRAQGGAPGTTGAGGAPRLRFKAGAEVYCNMGPRGWALGTVEATEFRDPSWPEERGAAAYKIHLNGAPPGTSIYAPQDTSMFVRPRRLLVRIPPGAKAGQVIKIMIDGLGIGVKVPDKRPPNDMIPVMLPPPPSNEAMAKQNAAHQQQQQQQEQQQAAAAAQAPAATAPDLELPDLD